VCCCAQESLRDAQVNLRKHVQENESLEFRNQQLSKRVVLLQEDVNSPSKNKKKRVREAI
jgi:protein phosphatase 1 regulatory subunit 21